MVFDIITHIVTLLKINYYYSSNIQTFLKEYCLYHLEHSGNGMGWDKLKLYTKWYNADAKYSKQDMIYDQLAHNVISHTLTLSHIHFHKYILYIQ